MSETLLFFFVKKIMQAKEVRLMDETRESLISPFFLLHVWFFASIILYAHKNKIKRVDRRKLGIGPRR